MRQAYIVNRGVDTLMVNIYYTDRDRPIRRAIDSELAIRLDGWKRMAQELGEPFITPWVFNNASLQMQPNGAGHGQWPWMLKTPDITLYVSQGKWNGVEAVRLRHGIHTRKRVPLVCSVHRCGPMTLPRHPYTV